MQHVHNIFVHENELASLTSTVDVIDKHLADGSAILSRFTHADAIRVALVLAYGVPLRTEQQHRALRFVPKLVKVEPAR